MKGAMYCSLMILLMTFWSLSAAGSNGLNCRSECPDGNNCNRCPAVISNTTCWSWCSKWDKISHKIRVSLKLKGYKEDKCKWWCPDELEYQQIMQSVNMKNLLGSNDTDCPLEYRSCSDCIEICKKCLKREDISDILDICEGLCSGVCSQCALGAQCNQILLFDGGFTGQIHNSCNDTKVTSNCLNTDNKSLPLTSTCMLSFEANATDLTNETCRFSDSGVWLLNNASEGANQYKINITRNTALRPQTPICFVTGSQNCTTRNERLINCTQPKGNSTWQCENVTCVDPTTICLKAEYINCTGNSSNDDIITLRGSSAVCIKCGTPFKQTEAHIHLNLTFPPDSGAIYSDVINNINNIVLKAMENKSSVSVSFDNISGIFVKPQPELDYAPIYIMYSDYYQFNIIEDKTQMKAFERTFSVPQEAFEKVASKNTSTVFASLLKFPTFPQDNENSTLLNGEVYSIEMGEKISNLTNTFNLTFRNIDLSSSYAECRSWNGTGNTPNWTVSGCNTSYTNDSVTCKCEHLTFFAVLMTPVTKIPDADLKNLTYLTSIGCGLSLFFISIALFMHFLLRKGRSSISVHILISLFLALFLLNISFLVNESVANTGNEIGCKFAAGVMHYSMLSAFSWFGLQALHLCLQLAQNVSSIQNYIVKLSILGWVPPALVVTATFIFHKYDKLTISSDAGTNVSMCWITDPVVHYVVNIGYYVIIFLFTLLTFVVMLRWLWLLRTKRPNIAISGKQSRPSDALTIMGLCCVLGLSWGFAFFSYGPMQIPAFYIFTILNSLQGFFLFIYYYKSSKLVGEDDVSGEGSSYTTESTEVQNPYGKPKTF